MNAQQLFLTFFNTGHSPKYPTVVASTVALLIGVALLVFFGMETLFMLTLAVSIIGIFEINKYRQNNDADTHSIVIDKVAGVWLSLMIAFSTALTMPYPYSEALGTLLSLLSFTLFDIWKPSTIGWINREVTGGLGKMMATILSGIAGGLFSAIILMGVAKLF